MALGFSELVGAWGELPPPSSHFLFFTQAKRLFKKTIGPGSAPHCHQECFFLTDWPGSPSVLTVPQEARGRQLWDPG